MSRIDSYKLDAILTIARIIAVAVLVLLVVVVFVARGIVKGTTLDIILNSIFALVSLVFGLSFLRDLAEDWDCAADELRRKK